MLRRLQDNLSKVLLGKEDVIRLAVIGVLAEGHLLLEDVPGVGKTLLAKALARSISCTFHRIQFTPDLLPSDLIGTSVYHPPSGQFNFHQGPLFAHVVLADEINRATPRTQSALLESMSEQQVSVDGATHHLGPPFIVLATQNPFEFEGTYPLPENQLDRFSLRLHLGYPPRAAEKQLLRDHRQGEPVEHLPAVLTRDEFLSLQGQVRQVRVEDSLENYLLDVLHATRTAPQIFLGASTRAALGWYRAAQALALVEGRQYVIPDDLKRLAGPVLAHRLVLKGTRQPAAAELTERFVQELLHKVPVPN